MQLKVKNKTNKIMSNFLVVKLCSQMRYYQINLFHLISGHTDLFLSSNQGHQYETRLPLSIDLIFVEQV